MARYKPLPADLGDRPWRRLPGETEAQHRWFLRYLEMPLPRSIRRLAPQYGTSEQHLYDLSSARRWADRAWAYEMAEQTQWDRETALIHRRVSIGMASRSAKLADRCYQQATEAVTTMSAPQAAHAAAEHAQVHHRLTSTHAPPPVVQVNATAHAAAQAGAASSAEASLDAAHGRDAGLYAEILAAVRADVQAEHATHHREQPGAAGAPPTGAAREVEPDPGLAELLAATGPGPAL